MRITGTTGSGSAREEEEAPELADFANGVRPGFPLPRTKAWFMKVGFPDACQIPKDGIPKDAHIIRVTPCQSEHFCQGTYCLMIKIMRGRRVAGGSTFVEGWGDALDTVRQQTTQEFPNGKTIPAVSSCHFNTWQAEYMRKCERIEKGELIGRPSRHIFCALMKVAQDADVIIRNAVAKLRFSIGREQIKKLQKGNTNPLSPEVCAGRTFQALVRSVVAKKTHALEADLRACSRNSENTFKEFVQTDERTLLGEGVTLNRAGCNAAVREEMDRRARELRQLLEQCQKAARSP